MLARVLAAEAVINRASELFDSGNSDNCSGVTCACGSRSKKSSLHPNTNRKIIIDEIKLNFFILFNFRIQL